MFVRRCLIALAALSAAGCGGSDEKEPTGPGSGASLTGIWFSSTATSERKLYLDGAGKFLEASSLFVTYPDFDPWTADPTTLYGSDLTMGSYAVQGNAIRFTHLDNGRTESFGLSTEGLGTATHDDDSIVIGARGYLWDGAVTQPLPAVPELSNVSIRAVDAAGAYDLYVISTAESELDTDYFGMMPITLRFSSFGECGVEVRVADYHWLLSGESLPMDGGAALGVDCCFDTRDGGFVFYANDSSGSIRLTKFQQVGNTVVVSGVIAPTVLFDSWDEDRSVTIQGSFEDVVVAIVS